MFGIFGLSRLSHPLPSNHRRVSILGGNAGTAQTIARMRDLVTQGKRDFRLRTFIGTLLQQCPNKDYECFARAIHGFCTHQIKYVFDPNGVELIEAPYRILESRVADCDSIVVLAAAMLESIGLPARFVTIKADAARPSEWSHVFLEAKIPGKGWMGLDCTMPDEPFGWEPPGEYERKTWNASRDGVESHDDDRMAGLAMSVPHVEYTKGVVVGPEWDFREEAGAVTPEPEALELEPLKGTPVGQAAPPAQEFFMKEDIPAAVLRETSSSYAEAPVVDVSSPGIDWKKWILIGGVAFVLLHLGGRR